MIANATGGDGTDIGAVEFSGLLRIISITCSGADVVIGFEGVEGFPYRLERRPSLIGGNWQSISGVNDVTPGSSDSAQITDPNATALGEAFYRVRLLP